MFPYKIKRGLLLDVTACFPRLILETPTSQRFWATVDLLIEVSIQLYKVPHVGIPGQTELTRRCGSDKCRNQPSSWLYRYLFA